MNQENYGQRRSYKSRGEERIADFLESQDIAFQYEYPLAIKDREMVKIWYPDFRLPEYAMIIEYFGMNGNDSYREQMVHKMLTYEKAGVDGIYLMESSFQGDWQEQILETIERSLEDRLRKISSCKYDTATMESQNYRPVRSGF